MSYSPTTGYFNAASHGVPAPGVFDVMRAYLSDEAQMGPLRAAVQWHDRVQAVRQQAAKLVGGATSEIGFSTTTTAAWHALLAQMDLSGKRVLVSSHEWGAYLRALSLRHDITVEVLPEIDLKAPDLSPWADRIGDDVGAIFMPMITSITGQSYPLEQIGKLARPAQAKFIVDGAQALGQVDVSVADMNCDAFISTGRKWLRGPRQSALIWMGADWQSAGQPVRARDLESLDQNLALRLGLGVAIEAVLEVGASQIQRQILDISDQIKDWARAHDLPLIAGKTGGVSIKVNEDQVAHVQAQLDDHDIHAKLCDAAYFEPMSCQNQSECTVLRLSPHTYTTQADLAALFEMLRRSFAN